MIIDYSAPALNGKEWTVRVIKTTPKGDLYPQNESTRYHRKWL